MTNKFANLALMTDHSDSFNKLRLQLKDSQGRSLLDFMKTLQPSFKTVYWDITFGYIAILSTVVIAITAEKFDFPFWLITPLTGFLIGFWVAYLLLFIHEGAHWNLAADKKNSDRICNLVIAWWAGMDISDYRRIHFQHHRALGTTQDSEFSYFFPIDIAFVAKSLCGLRALDVFISRRDFLAGNSVNRKSDTQPKSSNKQLIIGLIFHSTCFLFFFLSGFIAVAMGWVIGLGIFFPFFGALRQMLEHRSEQACATTDYRAVDQGAITRMFGDGFFARTFGGAGFNRHLLHHWEPTVSYTCLASLEHFLLDTEARQIIQSRQTTYRDTFIRLISLG